MHEYLSDDGQVLLALCSAFGVPVDAEASGLSPLKLSEWNQLAKKINDTSFKRPAGLQGQTEKALARELVISSEEATRIARLVERVGGLTFELENLYSRGIWAVTRVDEKYPAKLRDTLKQHAPTVLFGAGEIHLLQRRGLAVIGSRNIDEVGAVFAKEVGRKAVQGKMAVVSGGARGTDRIAMDGALEAGGIALGAMADSLETTVRKSDVRELLMDGRLTLVTPYAPTAGFSVGAAMGRNKLIYGLSDFAVVVSSDFQTGGTWSGAIEALKAGWCPIFARDGADVPKGNRELIKCGAGALPADQLANISDLSDWMNTHAVRRSNENEFFDFAKG